MASKLCYFGLYTIFLCNTLWGEPHNTHVNQPNDAFWIIDEQLAHRMTGMLMICPAHRHGKSDAVKEKLTNLVVEYKAKAPTSAWVCRSDQLNTLAQIAPLVEQIAINPFVDFNFSDPSPTTLMWPNTNHPTINQLRTIRQTAGHDKRLLACINLRGEPTHYEKREATFEEIQWMTFAVIGSRFQGLIWRSHHDIAPDWKNRFLRLEKNLLRYADSLGKTKQVEWAKVEDDTIPISALATDHFLFVCLLNPQYMNCQTDQKNFSLPLEPHPQKVTLKINFPENLSASSAKTLSGFPSHYSQQKNQLTLTHTLSSGGEMFVFILNRP